MYMKMHERVDIFNKAKIEFSLQYSQKTEHTEVRYDNLVHAFSLAMINQYSEDKTILDEHHQILEDVLSGIVQTYSLTYGEVIAMLSEYIQKQIKYLIRYERHGDFTSPADWA